MTFLICAATGRELAALAPDIFPDAESIQEMQPMSGDIAAGKAIFLVTGVGPINAALAVGFCLGLTLDKKNGPAIDAVLCAGLAGAYDLERCPLDSIWQVREEIWPEYGLNDGRSVTARAFSFPLWKRGQNDVYDRLPLAGISDISAAKSDIWPECAAITVAGVSASFARRDALWNTWRAPLENMEGFAVAYAAARANIPCVEIRAVSNKVGPRSREEKDFEGALLALGQVLPTMKLV